MRSDNKWSLESLVETRVNAKCELAQCCSMSAECVNRKLFANVLAI